MYYYLEHNKSLKLKLNQLNDCSYFSEFRKRHSGSRRSPWSMWLHVPHGHIHLRLSQRAQDWRDCQLTGWLDSFSSSFITTSSKLKDLSINRVTGFIFICFITTYPKFKDLSINRVTGFIFVCFYQLKDLSINRVTAFILICYFRT